VVEVVVVVDDQKVSVEGLEDLMEDPVDLMEDPGDLEALKVSAGDLEDLRVSVEHLKASVEENQPHTEQEPAQ
jgi:hypothetical protein